MLTIFSTTNLTLHDVQRQTSLHNTPVHVKNLLHLHLCSIPPHDHAVFWQVFCRSTCTHCYNMLKRASNAPAAVQACQSAAACRCTAHATLTAIGSCSAHHRTLKERTHFKVASLFGGTRSPTVCRASSDVDQHTADSTQKLQSPTQQSTIISSSQPIGNHNITVYSHYSSSGRSHTPCSSSSSSRRELLLHSSLTPLLVQLLIGSDDATTIVNSVLSAYGLPTFKATAGFKLYE